MATRLWPKSTSFHIFSFVLWLELSVAIWGLSFTKTPPALQYVLEGENATFAWDYNETISGNLLFGSWTKEGSAVACISKTTTVIHSSDQSCQNFFLEGLATLILANVSKSMNGRYECVLNFLSSKRLESSASLKVVSKAPTFLPLQVNATAIEGSKSVLITIKVGGDYLPIISWYKNNVPVNASQYPTSSKEVNSSFPYVKMIQSNFTVLLPKRDINNNKFVAMATYGTHSPTSSASIDIVIWYGPENLQISSSKSGMVVLDGQPVTINCTAVSNPPSTFTFFRNNSAVLAGSVSGILNIPSFGRNDSGNYSCMATNGIGNATAYGVWFVYVAPTITTTTTQKPTPRVTNGTTGQSNSPAATTSTAGTPKPGGTTGSASSALPWWVWLAIGIGATLFLTIPILVFCIIKRNRSKKRHAKSPARFSKKEFDIDNYIMATSYPSGYENHMESSVDMTDGQKDANRERSIDNPDPEAARTNIGVKFESEHDLIEHCRKRPDDDDGGDDDVDAIDFKYYDPFEDDSMEKKEHRDPYVEDSDDALGFDNQVYQEDDIVKVKSESDKESEREHELFTDLGEDIVQYEI